MKVCKYCNSLANDSALECDNCGASDFGYQCENCGTVSSSRFCPSCGLKIGPRIEICPTCGTQFQTPTCPRCGYPNVRSDYSSDHQGQPSTGKAEKKTTVGTILLWIFFLPVMLLITVWKSPKLALVWKVLITCLVLLTQIFPYLSTSRYQSSHADTEAAYHDSSVKPAQVEAAKSDPKTAYEITYQNVRVYENQGGMVFIQGIVELMNTGSTNLALNGGSMDFEDDEGNLLAAQKAVGAYPDILRPGEKGYLYCLFNYESTMPGTIKMIARPNLEETDSDPIRLAVSDVSVVNTAYGEIKVLGRIENTSSTGQDSFHVAAILLDDKQTPIAILYSFFSEKMEPDDKIGFELDSYFIPEDITAETVSSVLAYAYPMFSLDSIVSMKG